MVHHNDFQGDVLPLSLKLEILRSALRGDRPVIARVVYPFDALPFSPTASKKAYELCQPIADRGPGIEIFHNLTKLTGWTWSEDGPCRAAGAWMGRTYRADGINGETLVRSGIRVVAFDAPGHGLSPHTGTHLIDYRDAIQDVIEQYGPFHAIVAHSFGALAATIMLRDKPSFMPEKLALLSPMRDLDEHLGIFAALAGLSPVRKDRLRKLIAKRLGVTFIEQYSTVEAVHSLDIPGLVIHDRQDTLIPYEVGEAVAQNWHESCLVSTYGMGHQQGLKNPFVIQTITDYLTNRLQPQIRHRISAWEDFDPLERMI